MQSDVKAILAKQLDTIEECYHAAGSSMFEKIQHAVDSAENGLLNLKSKAGRR